MTQKEPKYRPSRWSLGIDPGFRGTGLCLLADGVPVAAALANDQSPKPVQHRMRRMGLWFTDTIQEWIYSFQIESLHVVMELAFMRKGDFDSGSTLKGNNVKTMATQMRMIGVFENCLYDLKGCDIWLGSVTNSESKMQFTGHGNASKDIVIAMSVFKQRTDIDAFRDHLADAQAHGTCYPVMTELVIGVDARNSRFSDGGIGIGPKWAPKTRPTRKAHK